MNHSEVENQLLVSRVAAQCVCCSSTDIISSPAILMPFVAHRALGWIPIKIDESWGLKTIRSGYAYSVCRSLYCNDCRLLFMDIRFSDREMMALYRDYRGDDYTALRDFYEPGYKLRNEFLALGNNYINLIEEFVDPYICSPISILDWGGDTGKNTPFKNKAEKIHVFDISGRELAAGGTSISREMAFSGNYTLIVCSNVLEHVPFPAEVLSEISKAMKKNTVLYLEVPFEEVMRNPEVKLPYAKKHWHEHINFFSENSLIELARRVGLEIIQLRALKVVTGGNFSHVFQVACRLPKD